MKAFKNILDALQTDPLFQNSEGFYGETGVLNISNPEKTPGLMFSHWLSICFSASDFPCAILLLAFSTFRFSS